MGSLITIFSLYQCQSSEEKHEKYILLRTNKPGYPNYSQLLDDLSNKIECQKRELLLTLFLENEGKSVDQSPILIGELQEYPIGDDRLYSDQGLFDLPIVYVASEKGFPWFIMGGFERIEDFNHVLLQDEDLMALSPTGEVNQVLAMLVTENDFDLSGIPYFNVEDLRDI